MKATDIRNSDGSFTDIANEVYQKFMKGFEDIFKEYKDKLHPDDLEKLGITAVTTQSTFSLIDALCED